MTVSLRQQSLNVGVCKITIKQVFEIIVTILMLSFDEVNKSI